MRTWLFLLLIGFGQSLIAAPVRLAIVPKSPAVNSAADLLTAAFSKFPDIQTLERADLEKILRERSLAANRSADVVTAAQFLGADALLLIEPGQFGTNKSAILRLVSVKPGAILSAIQRRWPMDEADKWVASVTAHFGRLLPKVLLPEDRLVKISLLNLRSPSTSAGSQLLDRELTTLTRLRLAREPEIILLERQDLSSLTMEKDLAASTEKFWTGSHLLDGAVNRDGIMPGRVMLDVRLIAPTGATNEIHIDEPGTNLVAMVERLSAEVMKTLHQSSSGRFDPITEANAYFGEAEWSLRWQMFPEAIAAADSAWALGKQDLDSARTRLLCYARSASRVSYQWTGTSYDGAEFGWFLEPPDPAQVPRMNEALSFISEIMSRFTNSISDRQSYLAICETLALAGNLLHQFYFRAELREGIQDQLAQTRKLAREAGARVMEHPEVEQDHGPGSQDARVDPFDQIRDDIFGIMATYGVFFNETPEQTLDLYNDLMRKHPSRRLSRAFEHRALVFAPIPLFGGWKWEDRKRAQDFVEKFKPTETMRITPEGARVLTQEESNARVKEFVQRQKEAREAREASARERALKYGPPPPPPPVVADAGPPRPEGRVLSSSLIENTEYWIIPTNKVEKPNAVGGEMIWPVLRDNELWFRYAYRYYRDRPFVNRAYSGHALMRVEPAAMTARTIPLNHPQFENPEEFFSQYRERTYSFEIDGNTALVAHQDKLFSRKLEQNSWAVYPLPAADGYLFRVHGKIYLSGTDSIHEVLNNGAATRVIASARRRPAATILDELPAFGRPTLLPGPARSVRAVLTNGQYRFNGAVWIPEIKGTTNVTPIRGQAAFLRVNGDDGYGGAGLIWTSPNKKEPELLLRTPAYSGLQQNVPTDGRRFIMGRDLIYQIQPFEYNGEAALLNMQSSLGVGWGFKYDGPFEFYFFPPAAPCPIRVPMRFPKAKMPGYDRGIPARGAVHLLESETHLLFAVEDLPGIWRIPKSEIDARIRETISAYNITNAVKGAK